MPMPVNPTALFEPKLSCPVGELRKVFRGVQLDALVGLSRCADKEEALKLQETIAQAAGIVKQTCRQIADHPGVRKEELSTFKNGVERSLALYRAKLAARILGNPALEATCFYIERHKDELLAGSGRLDPVISGLSYPLLVDGRISIETEEGAIAYPEASDVQ